MAWLTTACSYCEEIIWQTPDCAVAYSELALSLFLLEKLGAVRREDCEPKVRAAIDRALCLDERPPTIEEERRCVQGVLSVPGNWDVMMALSSHQQRAFNFT